MTGTIICTSTPEGASVKVTDDRMFTFNPGSTPVTVSVDPNKTYTLLFTKDLYTAKTVKGINVKEGETLEVTEVLDLYIPPPPPLKPQEGDIVDPYTGNVLHPDLCIQKFHVTDAETGEPIEGVIMTSIMNDAEILKFARGYSFYKNIHKEAHAESDKPGWYWERMWDSHKSSKTETTWNVLAQGHKSTPITFTAGEKDVEIALKRGDSPLDVIEKVPEGINRKEKCVQRFHIYDAYTRKPIEDAVISTEIPIWSRWHWLRPLGTYVSNGWYDLDMFKWFKWDTDTILDIRPVLGVYVIAPGYATPLITFMHCKKDLEIPLFPGNSARDVVEMQPPNPPRDVVFGLCRQNYFIFNAITGKPLTGARITSRAIGYSPATPVSGKPGWYLSARVPKWGPPPPPGFTEFPRPDAIAATSAGGYETRMIRHIVCKKDEYIPLLPVGATMAEVPRSCPVAIPDVPYVDPGEFVPPEVIAPGDVTPVPDEMTQLVCKSTPPGAVVAIVEAKTGNVLATGKSPITYRVPVAHEYIVIFEKAGYKKNRVTVVK